MSFLNSSQPRSLRTELLIAQLAVLTLVVLGFAGAIYGLVRNSVYREAESDLLGAAQMIAQELRSGTTLKDLTITRTYRHRFGPAPRDHAYFAIWNDQKELIAGDDPLPPHVKPLDRTPPRDGPRPFFARHHGHDLEVIVPGPDNQQISVGRPLAKEMDRLQNLALILVVAGLFALTIGGLAAWWSARRIADPLEKLTATAEQISAQKLEQRLEGGDTFLEITRLRKVLNAMLDRLQASFQQQVHFTADASHELRTPVTVVLTQVEHSLSRPRSNEDYASALQTCGRAARRMKRLVDDLLLLARSDAGRLETRREICDLAEIASATVAMLEPLAQQRQIRLQTDLTSTLVSCNAAQITQVLTNLVTNAIHYNRDEGLVQVSLKSVGNQAVLTILDSGIGIATEDQTKIFDRFFQADKSRTPQAGHGTGLGLSIVSEIVAAHGGTIEVASNLGQGSTFTISLPLASAT